MMVIKFSCAFKEIPSSESIGTLNPLAMVKSLSRIVRIRFL
jgi:hypothetical protein